MGSPCQELRGSGTAVPEELNANQIHPNSIDLEARAKLLFPEQVRNFKSPRE